MAAYSTGYENYDPYTSRSMSRSMSRRQSIGYPGTPYGGQSYSDGAVGSEVSISLIFPQINRPKRLSLSTVSTAISDVSKQRSCTHESSANRSR